MDEVALRRALCFKDSQVLHRLFKLVDNILAEPHEEKYRTLKTNNAMVQSLLDVPGIKDFLSSAGFTASPERPGILAAPAPSEEMLHALRRARERILCDLQARTSAAEAAATVHRHVEASVAPAVETDRKLVVFDFDSTITVDDDKKSHGLDGERLEMLRSMADRLLAAGVCTVLVTKQFTFHTRTHTIPVLKRVGLGILFCAPDALQGSGPEADDAMLYRQNPSGGIYTGTEARDKVHLIGKILAGENRWRLRFKPERVLFIDDNAANFTGHEELGISVQLVEQDGMNEGDVERVLGFAREC